MVIVTPAAAGDDVVAGSGGGGGGGVPSPSNGEAKKLTSIDTTTNITPTTSSGHQRLIEYFVVVSSIPRRIPDKNESTSIDSKEDQISKKQLKQQQQQEQQEPTMNDWKVDLSFEIDNEEYSGTYDFSPIISGRYPVADHRDNPLHENVTFFCHPSGGIRLQTEENMPKVHYFVATGGHGRQMYGTCLTLWEPVFLSLRKKDTSTATSTTTKSTNPFDDQEDNPHAMGPNEKKKEVFLPKCLVLLSTYPYLMAFREYLTQLNRLSKMGEMTLPIERYIANFCSELPAPPPGSFEVQTTMLDSVIKIWSPPDNQPIPWVSLPFSILFECLDTDNIILVWHCLVLERQVLLTSTQLSILTITAEIFLSLLFPMRWSHAYIPVLPHFLIPILSAPMPFLCGINKANLADALYDLSSECVLVDLDKNLVTLGPDTQPLPPIPPAQLSALKIQLEDNVGMVFREARCLTKNDDYSDSGAHLPNHIKLMAEGMWESKLCLFDEAFHLLFTPEESRKNLLNGNDTSGMDWSDRDVHDPIQRMMSSAQNSLQSATGVGGGGDNSNNSSNKGNQRKQSRWDAVQEAFLDTFVYLLRNFRKFLVFPSKHNEGSYGGAGFRSKEFIESQRFDMREFLEQLIGTQMFDNFITKRLYGSGEADVAFFDQAVDRFLKHAGLFSDIDVGGRIMHAANTAAAAAANSGGGGGGGVGANNSNSLSTTPDKRNNQAAKARSKALRSFASNFKSNVEPLLQSARVHRKLKTIVPPEPSGEGLPESIFNTEGTNLNDSNVIIVDADAASVQSATSTIASESGGGGATITTATTVSTSTYRSGKDKAADILEKKKKQVHFTYPTFPTKFNNELFGTPRPLPSAVMAEFDRQRKDAAQFRRKKKTIAGGRGKNKNLHLQRAHNMTGNADGNEPPPSPEVATFTVFFMAFTAMVGKELLELASNTTNDPLAAERTILSTYVPVTAEVSLDLEDSSVVSGAAVDETLSEGGTPTAEGAPVVVLDEEEKEGVAEMKTTRPDMNGMFNDEDNDDTALATVPSRVSADKNAGKANNDVNQVKPADISPDVKPAASTDGSVSSPTSEQTQQQPRKRFADSLTILQIEEAKATGRAQLGLAFEMLTMMKKRALKADPEAYQCLIDACGRVGDTKRATELLGKMHEDGIVADGTVYACLVSAFSAESAWKQQSKTKDEELPAWANSTSIEMDWNRLQKRSLLDRIRGKIDPGEDEEDYEDDGTITGSTISKVRALIARRKQKDKGQPSAQSKNEDNTAGTSSSSRMEFFVTESVERQIALGENLLEIVFPDISVDTENETCPRCNFLLSDDDVVVGWTPGDYNDYTTSCPNCTQRFVPHFCVQSTSSTFMGSRGPASPLMCERLSPWVLQKEIRSVIMTDNRDGIENLLSPKWREQEYKNAVLWWNLVLSCMRYRFPFSFLLQGSFEQNLIAPMPEDDA